MTAVTYTGEPPVAINLYNDGNAYHADDVERKAPITSPIYFVDDVDSLMIAANAVLADADHDMIPIRTLGLYLGDQLPKVVHDAVTVAVFENHIEARIARTPWILRPIVRLNAVFARRVLVGKKVDK